MRAHYIIEEDEMKKSIILVPVILLAFFASCQLPGITWTTVNPQGGAAPSFQNNWANSGGATQPLSFGKDALGQVHISGAIFNSGTVNATVIFALPSGFIPSYDKYLPVIVAAAGGTPSGAGELRIHASNGDVELITYIGLIQYGRFSDVTFSLN
jgi:hypothetical protein